MATNAQQRSWLTASPRWGLLVAACLLHPAPPRCGGREGASNWGACKGVMRTGGHVLQLLSRVGRAAMQSMNWGGWGGWEVGWGARAAHMFFAGAAEPHFGQRLGVLGQGRHQPWPPGCPGRWLRPAWLLPPCQLTDATCWGQDTSGPGSREGTPAERTGQCLGKG